MKENKMVAQKKRARRWRRKRRRRRRRVRWKRRRSCSDSVPGPDTYLSSRHWIWPRFGGVQTPSDTISASSPHSALSWIKTIQRSSPDAAGEG